MRNPWTVFFLCLSILFFSTLKQAYSATRWSTLHLVPDPDFLEGGQIVLEGNGYYFSDIDNGSKIKPAGTLDFGITEWVNLQVGYAGGLSLGFKARILGETKPWMPSFAIGSRNIFSNTESYYFNRSVDSLNNEFYFVFAKSIQPIRLRIHLGMLSIPSVENERYNLFFALEKYFGLGLYVSAEVYRRDKSFHPSLLASWRFWKQRLEVSAGVVDIIGMFMDDKNKKGFSLASSDSGGFVRPGIYMGLRFKIGLKKQQGGFSSLDDRVAAQELKIIAMKNELDSITTALNGSSTELKNMHASLNKMNDDSTSYQQRLRINVIDKLGLLKTLYSQEPFEPEQVKKVIGELVNYRGQILPILSDVSLNKAQPQQIRTLAVTVMGEIGSRSASDFLIEVLSQAYDPDMKIEALIALGKIKETRAVYLIQQLANDPDEEVAFTASEVLQKLEKETGIKLTKGDTVVAPVSIPETKIGGRYQPVSLTSDHSANKGKISVSTSKMVGDSSITEKPASDSLHKVNDVLSDSTNSKQIIMSDTLKGNANTSVSRPDSTKISQSKKLTSPQKNTAKTRVKKTEGGNSSQEKKSW